VTVQGPINKVNLERLTNGIYAFTMTLLIRNIALPDITVAGSATTNPSYYDAIMEKFFYSVVDYVGAFLILALFWYLTFQMIHRMERVDRKFIAIHLLCLMVIVFMPLTHSLAQWEEEIALVAVFEQANFLLIGLFVLVEWLYVMGKGSLLAAGQSRGEKRYMTLKLLVPVLFGVIGIALAAAELHGTDFCYFLPALTLLLIPKRFRSPDSPESQQ